ncbi:hypothetical protein ZOSMA_8G00560 [Zostera marina]|uniref:Uncharacterized protein n=1 Tax=Zostera marina TaxID=29655 RepID=A0A0K9NLF1_ZOSMR|nr:hypothetical protein ZOSMA_8G00560 [Zostera marina]
MLQSHLQSPARLGLTNPNSPLIPPNHNPNLKLPSSTTTTTSFSHNSIQPRLSATSSSVLIPRLPPLSRAQCLLLQMSSLASNLFEVCPNPSIWLTAFRGTLPTFFSSPPPLFTVPKLPLVSTTKEVLVLFTSLQTQLFEAVGELQEILNFQDAKDKLSREIRSTNGNLLGFSKRIGETERALDNLMDDYEDYQRLKRRKIGDEEKNYFESWETENVLLE